MLSINTEENKMTIKIKNILSLAALLLFSAYTIASSSAILNSQQIKAGETPDGISTTQWQSIQTQVNLGKYKAYASDAGGYQSSNPANGWQIDYGHDGTTTLSPYNNDENYHISLRLNSVFYQSTNKGQNSSIFEKPDSLSYANDRLNYHWDNNITEYWINSEQKLEQWFEIKQRPKSFQNNVQQSPLQVQMTLDTNLEVSLNDNRLSLGSITYDKLKVWDATGQIITANLQLKGKHLNLVIEDKNATYPLTIDPSFAQQAYLKASNTDVDDEFGRSVSISGDTLVIGATGEESNATGINGNQSNNSLIKAGAAYVFVRSGTTWSQQAYLKASNTGLADQFGYSVSISGDTLVVGANGEDSNATGVNNGEGNNSRINSGAVYVFVRNGTTWSQQAYVKASNTGTQDFFGYSVSISGNTLVVGAYGEKSNATGVNGNQGNNSFENSGAAYVFFRSGGTWSQQAYLKASNAGEDDEFGNSVSISGDTVVVGAHHEGSNAIGVDGNQSDNSLDEVGAAYVFVRSDSIWSQEAYLKASNAGEDDEFGNSVSISGDTVVVGAHNERSIATGVNGDQSDNSEYRAGAVYVFVRSDSIWTQQAYVKASNTYKDQFGGSVSISGDTLVVGANREDSHATGVNGNQNDNSREDAGAAYVFVRSGATWAQQDYLKAFNTGQLDNFGWSVSISGDTLVIGAIREDSNTIGVNGSNNNAARDSGAAYVFTLTSTIGGTVTGLATGTTVTLRNNGGDDLTINSDGTFIFATALTNSSTYAVTVLTHPASPNQICTVSNDSGTIAGGDISNVTVTCLDTYTIGGTVTGLATGTAVTLQNNGGDDLTINSDGTFTFATALINSSIYAVTVLTHPASPNQICTVSNDSGTIVGDISNVAVTCLDTYTIGGTVTGLAADNTVTLQNNAGDDLTVNSDGIFTFATALIDGSAYTVTITSQPNNPVQTCAITSNNTNGNINGGDVIVLVYCNTPLTVVDNIYTAFEDTTLIADDADGSVNGLNDDGVLVNDFDVDADILTVVNPGTFTGTGIGGEININADGTFTYTAPADISGEDMFTFDITDGIHVVASNLNTEVLPVNDAPSFNILGDILSAQAHPEFINNTLSIPLFAFDIVKGPIDENNQTIEFTATIIADSDSVLAAGGVSVADDGELSLIFNGNLGLAIIQLTATDDGQTTNGGDDTSVVVEFSVSYTDLLFANGFEGFSVFQFFSYLKNLR